MTNKDVLPEKYLVRKAATINWFEYFPLGKELKTQTNSIAKRQCQKLGNIFEFDKVIEKEKTTIKKYIISNLIYNSKFSFYEYHNANFNSISSESKFKSSCNELNKFDSLIPEKQKKEVQKREKWLCMIIL